MKKVVATDDGNEFKAKWKKCLPEGWSDTAESKSNDELEEEVLKAESSINDLEKDMDNDSKLKVLKEDLKALGGGYKDAMKTEQAKIKFSLFLLRQRGAR